ncbi:spore protease YyaC [Cohnella lubricantis]|uniref:Spore protease YyaC n=1 Tax=Cohnella lubricantis TaxID=2163172 RepID=A0A841T9J4_9BACL|nr:spore protease YyaC [Cohnella lubricantis]MBB6677974.1 spore protease YyaC [Cohnella lubricantis]MBP2119958.1 putative sporulation protein YyaC [Cohnella lubricantis]
MVQASRPEDLLADVSGLRRFFAGVAARHAESELTFLCIGTDRSTGDSLGPWVGTMLANEGFSRVIGTLEKPCDADRLPEVIASLSPGEPVVAIDACLGRPENVGRFLVAEGPLQPAKSVGKAFAPVGAYSVAAIVNANGPKPYWTLQTTSLYHVLGMARQIAGAIKAEWPEPM